VDFGNERRAIRVGKLLKAWATTVNAANFLTASATYESMEESLILNLPIPEHATEMRAAANFLVANYGRQKIISMPRAVPK